MTESRGITHSMTLKELSEAIGARLDGDPEWVVKGIASLESAQSEQVAFLSAERFEKKLASSNAGAVILSDSAAEKFAGNCLVVDDPYLAYAAVSTIFNKRAKRTSGIHPSAVVSPSAIVDESASIGANCVIGDDVVIGEQCEIYPGVVILENASLGKNCLLYPNVTLYADVVIGDSVIIHSNTTIGSDGFGFAPSKEGWAKIQQLGTVIIGNNVEIGASASIDRGAIENTVIADGVIIDNQVHVAHNVEIGSRTAIAGCSGIAGSTKIGKNCTVAGMVAINGHIEIADGSHFNGGSVVTKGNKEPGAFGSSTPLQPVSQWRKNSVRYMQLDSIASRLKKLEKELSSSKS